jgi:hypothetical protein
MNSARHGPQNARRLLNVRSRKCVNAPSTIRAGRSAVTPDDPLTQGREVAAFGPQPAR